MPRKATKTPTLFGSESKDFSSASIRRGYDSVLDHFARLASFAASHPLKTSNELADRQEALAINDLISLALYARRLIDEVGVRSYVHNVRIYKIKAKGKDNEVIFAKDGLMSVWSLLGIVIHNEYIEIVRTQLEMRAIAGVAFEDIDFYRSPYEKWFVPKLAVRSDKGACVIDLLDFVNVFAEKVLFRIVEVCSDHGVYLEADMR